MQKNISENEIFNLLVKKWKAEQTKAEEHEIQKWLSAKPENELAFKKLERLWLNVPDISSDFEIDIASDWQKFQQKLEEKNKKTKVVSLFSKNIKWYALAASLLIAIGSIYFTIMYFTYQINQVYTTERGEEVKIMLPDSSLILLKESSRLSFSADFNNTERKVELNGEAFFEVKKLKGRNFKVLTQNTVTEVLGTSFTVRAYENENFVTVKVKTGKVSFAPIKQTEKGVFLLPGDSAQLQSVENSFKISTTPKLQAHQLKFDNASISNVFENIEESYGVKISTKDEKIYNCKYTGEFKGEKIEDLLNILCLTLDLKFTKNESEYIIEGVGCE